MVVSLFFFFEKEDEVLRLCSICVCSKLGSRVRIGGCLAKGSLYWDGILFSVYLEVWHHTVIFLSTFEYCKQTVVFGGSSVGREVRKCSLIYINRFLMKKKKFMFINDSFV